MPIFEYSCKQCKHEFEALIFGDQKAECPKCHGKQLVPQLSVFAVASKSSSHSSSMSAAPTGGGCGSCGDPRGPGACSLNDLD
jgi:putative FmdB family regulatory protein